MSILQLKVGRQYEFSHKFGNFFVEFNVSDIIMMKGIIYKSHSLLSKYLAGNEFIVDSPLMVFVRQVFPYEGDWFHPSYVIW